MTVPMQQVLSEFCTRSPATMPMVVGSEAAAHPFPLQRLLPIPEATTCKQETAQQGECA